MEHYVAYHSTKLMGRGYTPGEFVRFRSKKPESFLRRAIGSWVWVIVGEPNRERTTYRLVGVYAATGVEKEDDSFVLSGPGTPFDPPEVLDEELWFVELIREQANFSLGLNRISSEAVLATLNQLLADVGTAAVDSTTSPVVTFSVRDDLLAHDKFQAWRRENPEGFLVNFVSASRGLLHRVDCPHLGDDEWTTDDGSDLTRQRKAAAAGISILRNWGTAQGLQEIRTCADCNPVEDSLVVVDVATEMLVDGSFSFENTSDARRRVLASIVQRQGQPQFRKEMLDAYGGRCAVTECSEQSVLEAAHIIPYRGVWTNHPQNGLLLRTDLHTLFDLGLIAVNTSDMSIVVSPTLTDRAYSTLAGRGLSLPTRPEFHPSRSALELHRERSGF